MTVPGDLDRDADVDADDFDLFLAAFGHSVGGPEYNPEADYDRDGTVTFVDYQTWLGYYRNFIGQAGAPAPLEVLGDFQRDGHVDELDFEHFQGCLSGPGVSQVLPACQDADLDNDGDVDQSDFGILQRCLSGPEQMLDLSCKY